jgi:hypothetical protein
MPVSELFFFKSGGLGMLAPKEKQLYRIRGDDIVE